MELKHNLIFIVEDNEMYSLLLDYTLTNESVCRTMSFKSGEECIKNLHLNPMIVILDYSLPGMNGKETLQHIRKYNKNIPVVILTGNDDVEVARNFLNEGIFYYLIKGENTVLELEEVINKVIDCSLVKEDAESTQVMNRTIFGVVFLIVLTLVVAYFAIT